LRIITPAEKAMSKFIWSAKESFLHVDNPIGIGVSVLSLALKFNRVSGKVVKTL
jgi:hypothetical protein